MPYAWICGDCGEVFPESGSGDGMGKALSHTANTSKAGNKHKIRGLVDDDTGEVLVPGLNPRTAQAMGFIQGKAGNSRKDRARAAQAASQDDDDRGSGPSTRPQSARGNKKKGPRLDREAQSKTLSKTVSFRVGGVAYEHPGRKDPPRNRIPTPVTTTLEGWDLALPPYVFGLFSVAREVLTHDDGNPYEWTPEGLNDFLWDVVRAHLEFVLPPLLARASDGQLPEHAALRVLRRISNMRPEELVEVAQQAAKEVG